MVAPTNLAINPNLWDDKAEQVKSKVVCDDETRSYYNDEVRKLKSYLEKVYQSNEEELKIGSKLYWINTTTQKISYRGNQTGKTGCR